MGNTFQKTCNMPNTVLGIMGNKAINQFYILISANMEAKKTSHSIVEYFGACTVEVNWLC